MKTTRSSALAFILVLSLQPRAGAAETCAALCGDASETVCKPAPGSDAYKYPRLPFEEVATAIEAQFKKFQKRAEGELGRALALPDDAQIFFEWMYKSYADVEKDLNASVRENPFRRVDGKALLLDGRTFSDARRKAQEPYVSYLQEVDQAFWGASSALPDDPRSSEYKLMRAKVIQALLRTNDLSKAESDALVKKAENVEFISAGSIAQMAPIAQYAALQRMESVCGQAFESENAFYSPDVRDTWRSQWTKALSEAGIRIFPNASIFASTGDAVYICPGLAAMLAASTGGARPDMTSILAHELGHGLKVSDTHPGMRACFDANPLLPDPDKYAAELRKRAEALEKDGKPDALAEAAVMREKANQIDQDPKRSYLTSVLGHVPSKAEAQMGELSADYWASRVLALDMQKATACSDQVRLAQQSLRFLCDAEQGYSHPKGSFRVSMILANPEIQQHAGCPKGSPASRNWCPIGKSSPAGAPSPTPSPAPRRPRLPSTVTSGSAE